MCLLILQSGVVLSVSIVEQQIRPSPISSAKDEARAWKHRQGLMKCFSHQQTGLYFQFTEWWSDNSESSSY